MKGWRLSRAADADLSDIFWQGLERFGVAQTERYLNQLEDQFDFLRRFPEAARLRAELAPPVRAHPHGSHMIIYEIDEGEIVIVRIRSARENWTVSPLGEPDRDRGE